MLPLTEAAENLPFTQQVIATLSSPWSMAFLPDGRLIVTERPPAGVEIPNPTAEGHIRIVTQIGEVSAAIAGVPDNVGILDVILDPHFAENGIIYFSYLERDPAAPRIGRAADELGIDPAGVNVASGVLDLNAVGGPALTSTTIIWSQVPKIVSYPGSGEPGGRLTFSPDGTYLYISAGDRQEFDPVQSLDNTLGKILRIYPDGTIPADNPFVGVAGAMPEIWSFGHRNPYGLLFTPQGDLWSNEMGPNGGDELNVIQSSANYGWPYVSYGNGYDGTPIPKPSPDDGFAGSALTWTPVIAPAGMIFYSGSDFPQWQGDLLIPGLQSHGLVVVDINGGAAVEEARVDLGGRIRGVAQAPDGSVWVLFDGPDGRLVHLVPAAEPIREVGNDFNGDGRSDILWRNADGTIGDWLAGANGTFEVNNASLIHVSNGWQVAGTGDFNGDGLDDILWRGDGGEVGNWLAGTGGVFAFNAAAGITNVATSWQVAGIGDFDGDNRDDILWRHSDGTIGDWLGNVNGSLAFNSLSVIAVPNTWQVAGIGDFNGDNRDDILWRGDNGEVGNWLAGPDGAFAFNSAAAITDVPLGWQVAGIGDFNGDGRDDILWRSTDGTIGNWLANLDGSFAINGASLVAVPNDWQIAGIGDFNGDGRDDILWRGNGGQIGNWLAGPGGIFGYNADAGIADVPNSWHVEPDMAFV